MRTYQEHQKGQYIMVAGKCSFNKTLEEVSVRQEENDTSWFIGELCFAKCLILHLL